jgi:hypothetical protein
VVLARKLPAAPAPATVFRLVPRFVGEIPPGIAPGMRFGHAKRDFANSAFGEDFSLGERESIALSRSLF